MSALTLRVNGKERSADVDPNTPLLWVLRDSLGLPGTKFGCGMALCGACTVLADGEPIRACSTPVGSLAGKNITTIEGLAKSETQLHPLQEAWIEHDVPQCGYCQAGQLMSAAALLAKTPKPSDADIDAAMAGNICRCGTYQRIRAAIHTAAGKMGGPDERRAGSGVGHRRIAARAHARHRSGHARRAPACHQARSAQFSHAHGHGGRWTGARLLRK
jgi:aerobic-type carbon monoxide dehydrogenase small subunit (CoxS/CutS family)